jgi:UDP-N-acetylglucosamine 1-carboxyvinyltransferase
MSSYLVQGGNPLKGEIKVSGAKNSVLKLMAASLLADSPCVIENAPMISDVFIMAEVLRHLGAKVNFIENKVEIEPTITDVEAPYEYVSQMRASLLVLGPLLGKKGKARVARPGGCNIGRRKIDFHLKGLEALGAKINFRRGYIEAISSQLQGNRIFLDFPSVGATENLMMAGVLARGRTIIENAAREPEVVDLANFLKSMGARIEGAGTSTITIDGVKSLNGLTYRAISDRIEAGTFLIAGVITRGQIKVKGVNPNLLEMFLLKLEEAGAKVSSFDEAVEVGFEKELKAIDVATLPFPGFPTDLQPQMTSLLSLAHGTSIITENVFDNRFLYVEELLRLGADIEVEGKHAIIKGQKRLYGAPVNATDLRGGAALVLAGLAAEGTTLVREALHIDRGYENFEQKLRSLGAHIKREIGKEA